MIMNLLKLFTTNKQSANELPYDPERFSCEIVFWDKHEEAIANLINDMKECGDLNNGYGRASCIVQTEKNNEADPTAQIVLAKAAHKKGGRFYPIGYIPKNKKDDFFKCKPYVERKERYWRLTVNHSVLNGTQIYLECSLSLYHNAGL